jgi:hypothetical protein
MELFIGIIIGIVGVFFINLLKNILSDIVYFRKLDEENKKNEKRLHPKR